MLLWGRKKCSGFWQRKKFPWLYSAFTAPKRAANKNLGHSEGTKEIFICNFHDDYVATKPGLNKYITCFIALLAAGYNKCVRRLGAVLVAAEWYSVVGRRQIVLLIHVLHRRRLAEPINADEKGTILQVWRTVMGTICNGREPKSVRCGGVSEWYELTHKRSNLCVGRNAMKPNVLETTESVILEALFWICSTSERLLYCRLRHWTILIVIEHLP